MSIVHKLHSATGITKFIQKFELPKLEGNKKYGERFYNSILLDFSKTVDGLNLEPNNKSSYKGSFNPYLHNASKVQNVFSSFKIWMKDNYKLKSKQLC